MTWNIHLGKGRDGHLDLERVARVICAESPDVVALQELDTNQERTGGVDQPAELARLLGMHACFSPAVHRPGGGRYGQALLSRAKPRAQTIVPLPGPPDREPRTLIELEIELATTRVRFQAVHLGLGLRERLGQTTAILARHQNSVPCVLMGDLNASPWMPTIRRLGKRFRDATPHAGATWPSVFPWRRLDYILLGGRVRCASGHVISGGEASFASDHLGVSAELVFD